MKGNTTSANEACLFVEWPVNFTHKHWSSLLQKYYFPFFFLLVFSTNHKACFPDVHFKIHLSSNFFISCLTSCVLVTIHRKSEGFLSVKNHVVCNPPANANQMYNLNRKWLQHSPSQGAGHEHRSFRHSLSEIDNTFISEQVKKWTSHFYSDQFKISVIGFLVYQLSILDMKNPEPTCFYKDLNTTAEL